MRLAPPPIRTPINETAGIFNREWQRWLIDLHERASTYSQPRLIITGTYQITSADLGNVLVFDSPTAFTVTLPTAASSGHSYKCANVGAGTVTIAAKSGDTINEETKQRMVKSTVLVIYDYKKNEWLVGL